MVPSRHWALNRDEHARIRMSHGFTKIREMEIAEMAATAVVYRHDKNRRARPVHDQ